MAVAIGAATHVGWDEFTHAGRYGITHLTFLAASYPSPVGPLAGYRYAQYASGVIGLALIAVAALRRTRTPQPRPRRTHLARALPWLCLIAGAMGPPSGSSRTAAPTSPGTPLRPPESPAVSERAPQRCSLLRGPRQPGAVAQSRNSIGERPRA